MDVLECRPILSLGEVDDNDSGGTAAKRRAQRVEIEVAACAECDAQTLLALYTSAGYLILHLTTRAAPAGDGAVAAESGHRLPSAAAGAAANADADTADQGLAGNGNGKAKQEHDPVVGLLTRYVEWPVACGGGGRGGSRPSGRG